MSNLTGAKAAKRAAQAQADAAAESTRLAQASAAEAARQSAIQIAASSARDKVTEALEAQTLANKPEDVNVDTGGDNTSLTKKRARFQAAATDAATSIRI
jgi:hypothetical protein